MSRELTEEEYQRLLRLRDGLRQFLDWSGRKAVAAGITPAQHQLLLAIRAHQPGAPSLRDVAEHLLTRHHSTVQLIDRALVIMFLPVNATQILVGLSEVSAAARDCRF